MTNSTQSKKYEELANAFTSVRRYFVYAGVFSAAVNLLMLAPIIYMLQVYDRVIGSGSMSTLAVLTILLLCLLSAAGGFEWVRSRMLIGVSNRLEIDLRSRVFDATFKRALLQGGQSNAQPNGDLTGLRQFLTGNGLFAFFDAPWFPIYVAIMFMFHPWFGVAAIFAGIVMVVLAYVNEKVTNQKLKEANSKAFGVSNQISRSLQNAEVIAAMGMTADIRRIQEQQSDEVLELQTNASKQAALLTSISKSFRMIMQSMLLGLGALLALQQEISPGMMIAGSLLLGRALAPIDLLVGSWKGFTVARAQYDRLGQLLEQIPATAETMDLPAPMGNLTAQQITVIPPGASVPSVRSVSLALQAGESMAIVGPSASGKSSLARALLGIWPAAAGQVRLDNADIAAWDRAKLGPYIGYLPQDIELFDGTISENICRFGNLDSGKIVEAAKLAGVHEMILHLPQGYDTVIGASGGVLSGGQRQRIGMARAVYGNPRLIVLDEPNSNLDDLGEKQLAQSLERIKAYRCTVVVITHRTLLLGSVDKMLVMQDGAAAMFGPRDEVLAKLREQSQPAAQGAAKPAVQSAANPAALRKNESA